MKKALNILSFILGIIGLWPIIGFIVFIIMLVISGDKSAEFTTETRDVAGNQMTLIIALSLTFVFQVVGVIIALVARQKCPHWARMLISDMIAVVLSYIGMALNIIGIIFFVIIITLAVIVFSLISPSISDDDGTMDDAEKLAANDGNIENILTAVGEDMWGFDYPDDTPEDIVKLDLSPFGDLINNDTGIAFIDASSLDCPYDEDPDDTDYEFYLDDSGEVAVRCIDPMYLKAIENQ